MKPPTRLLDDPELDAEMRADLQTVVHHPHRVDMQRVAGALAAAIGSSVSATSHAASTASTAPAAGSGGALSGLPLALKLTLAAVGGSAVIGLAAVQLQPASHAPKASPPPVTAPVQRPAPLPRPPAALPAPTPAAAEPAEVTRPAPSAQSASRREIAQLRRIQQLMASDPAAAHRLAEASSREFPQGALREERDGLSVLALLRLGDPRAPDKAERFLSRYPQSPLAERIRDLLAGEPRGSRRAAPATDSDRKGRDHQARAFR